jgi:hypothetical protein
MGEREWKGWVLTSLKKLSVSVTFCCWKLNNEDCQALSGLTRGKPVKNDTVKRGTTPLSTWGAVRTWHNRSHTAGNSKNRMSVSAPIYQSRFIIVRHSGQGSFHGHVDILGEVAAFSRISVI